ncbi:MAG: methyltransferase domain-containing protein [Acidimicrobiia bacterium]|nr:methyltransferase domain-containing protein [Acidimicrobiia bacterium]
MSNDPTVGSTQWEQWRKAVDLDDYESRWDRMAEQGENPHGEVDFVMRFEPKTALDAGCGFGRVGIELAARGVEIVGVDLDADLLGRAQRRAPQLDWRLADLAAVDVGRQFELVVAAGNVIGFVDAAHRSGAVQNCARHVAPGGWLVMGNQLKATWPTIAEFDEWCSGEGLVPAEHKAGWEGEILDEDPDYVVTVHHRPAS